MSDKLETIKEIAEILVSPCEKLIEGVQSAIGKAYEPRYTRRMADARAHEIGTIRDAIEQANIPISYDGTVAMNNEDVNDLVERMKHRMLYQEIIKQINIDSVTDYAYGILEGQTTASPEPVDQDWMIRFFNSVEDISNEKMQLLWGKVLAGEVIKPHTYSMRTLETLKNLTQQEADLFSKMAPFVLSCPANRDKTASDLFIIAGDNYFPFEFIDVLSLIDAGLLLYNSTVTVGFNLSPGETECIQTTLKTIKVSNNGPANIEFRKSAYILTSAGKELFEIVLNNQTISEEKLKQLVDNLHNADDVLHIIYTQSILEICVID